MRIVLRILINAAALWVAAQLLDGIELSDRVITVLIVAAIFGLVNAFVKPILLLLTLPFTIVTLGLFIFVVNAAMLQITDFLTDGLRVDGFWTSVGGGIVISIVSWALSVFITDDDKKRRRAEHRG